MRKAGASGKVVVKRTTDWRLPHTDPVFDSSLVVIEQSERAISNGIHIAGVVVGASEMSPSASGRPHNRLLALLSDEDFRGLQPHLKTVSLEPKQTLYKQGERLRHVYFPSGGVVSMATLLPEGSMIEAAIMGDDGIVGIEAFFSDAAVAACETIAQMPVPGNSAERLSVLDFRRELTARPTLHRAVARYAGVLYAGMARLMACNAHHQVEARCARWLLMMHDRMHGQDFHLSHESLAAMLGVRRQSVSVVCRTLRAAGCLRYVHGRVTVLDRQGLEDAACDCYRVIRAIYDRPRS